MQLKPMVAHFSLFFSNSAERHFLGCMQAKQTPFLPYLQDTLQLVSLLSPHVLQNQIFRWEDMKFYQICPSLHLESRLPVQ
jgi:hypothetical protein